MTPKNVQKQNAIGNMVYRDKTLYGSEIVFDYDVVFFEKLHLSEADVTSQAITTLKKLGWKEISEIRQQKTNIPEIDDYLKSKTVGSKKKGHADIYLLMNNKLKIIVDNKNPNEPIEEGINDAIFYANCLLDKKYDIRVAMSYNGIKCLLKVFDSKLSKWVPFLIDGKKINAFPSKELVNLIYRHRDINSIIITEDIESINISNIIHELKEIYRNIPHIQNDNQKTIDFTIAFIALKSILEKHGHELGRAWSDLKVAEQKRLKEEIKVYVEDIIENLENGYEEIFRIKEDPKGKIKAFDFLEVLRQFPTQVKTGEKGYLIQIFETINKLPHLHSSKFDLFGEVYQSLMDKHTRKIFGQFFTPRHLIKTMIRLFYEGEVERLVGDIKNGKSEKPKTVCDPACGTGGFLVESFKFFASNTLGIDVIDLAKKCIYGFDIYPANAVRSRINMYLAGDGFSEITSLNSLKELNPVKDKFDYIITNPPFGKGDFCVEKNVIANKRKEINFLIKVVNLLKPHGKALIIVPDGILEAPTLAPLREWLIRECEMEKIVGLPKHEFAPYTHEKTYVLFLKKRPSQIGNLDEIKTERVWMYIMDTDGYANSDKRFRTGRKDQNGKWLHDELSLWRDKKGAFHVSILEENWRKKTQSPNEKYTEVWDNEIEGLKYGYVQLGTIFSEKYTSHPSVTKSNVLKLVKTEITKNPPKKINDILENETQQTELTIKKLRQEFKEILDSKGIFFEPYDKKFYDGNTTIIERRLDLLPEKYLRPQESDTIEFEDFLDENKQLVKEMKQDLKILLDNLRG